MVPAQLESIALSASSAFNVVDFDRIGDLINSFYVINKRSRSFLFYGNYVPEYNFT